MCAVRCPLYAGPSLIPGESGPPRLFEIPLPTHCTDSPVRILYSEPARFVVVSVSFAFLLGLVSWWVWSNFISSGGLLEANLLFHRRGRYPPQRHRLLCPQVLRRFSELNRWAQRLRWHAVSVSLSVRLLHGNRHARIQVRWRRRWPRWRRRRRRNEVRT